MKFILIVWIIILTYLYCRLSNENKMLNDIIHDLMQINSDYAEMVNENKKEGE